MPFIVQITIAVVTFILIYRVVAGKLPIPKLSNPLSDKVECPRCEGKGWWQNTRNRETCEWCKGSGKVPKDFPLL